MASTPEHAWTEALAMWAIPEAIISQAPTSPWIHPVDSFRPRGDLCIDSPSRLRALEALDHGGSVLDIGCGGGRAAFGLAPPATRVIGVDHQQAMLDVFAHEAEARELDCLTYLGDWPFVADSTPMADVVTCHHVFYNVGDLVPFVRALTNHARRRVVVELPTKHPLASLSPHWNHFWGLERPTRPTSEDALEVVRATGVDARIEYFDPEVDTKPFTDQEVEMTRIRLCLTSDKDDELRAFMAANGRVRRQVATIWWDT